MFTKLLPRFNSSPIDDDRTHGLIALNTVGVNQPLPISGFSLSGVGALAIAIVDGSGAQITSFGGGTQYTDAAAVTTKIGTGIIFNNAGTYNFVATNQPLPVTIISGNPTTIAATQSGTWTVGLSAAQTLATVTTVSAVTAITNALPSGSNLIGKVGIDQTTPGTTNAVSLAQIGGTTIVNGGVAGSQSVGGTVATNVAITANPINLGAQAVSSENSAVTTARQVQLVADLVGKLIVLPYANPENFVNGTTAAITDTTSTSVIASAGGSLRNYITSIIVTNSHATVGTFVKILDGASIIWEGYAAAAGGGFTSHFPTPLKGTAATAINAQAVTTGANFIVSCAGYKGL